MRKNLITMAYYETYYYANIVHNVLSDPFPYLRNLNSWHEDNEAVLFFPPFPKWTRLHELASVVIHEIIAEQIDDVTLDSIVHDPKYELWVDAALRFHGFEVLGFRAWLCQHGISLNDATEDDISEYHLALDLSDDLSKLVEQLANEVFFLLFGNRRLLQSLNEYIARVVTDVTIEQVPSELHIHLQRPGVLKRVDIPEWVKRAVFFRDRGMCASCNVDISGILSAQPDRHYDHIIPLAEGGINDVTNVQLLCGPCNLKKGRKFFPTSNQYESWY